MFVRIVAYGRTPWNANSEENIAGYKLHFGPIRAAPVETIDVGNTTTATIEGLHRDT